MTVTGVFTSECNELPDGRRKHYFRKLDGGIFVCQNCGHVSNPAQPWESRRKSA